MTIFCEHGLRVLSKAFCSFGDCKLDPGLTGVSVNQIFKRIDSHGIASKFGQVFLCITSESLSVKEKKQTSSQTTELLKCLD